MWYDIFFLLKLGTGTMNLISLDFLQPRVKKRHFRIVNFMLIFMVLFLNILPFDILYNILFGELNPHILYQLLLKIVFTLRIFSGCYDNTLQLWGIDGSHTMTIPAHAGPVKAIALIDVIDNTATLVSGSHDQTVMQWKIDLEKLSVDCVTIGKGHERSVECVSVDPTRTLIASGSWDTYLKIWTTSKYFLFRNIIHRVVLYTSYAYPGFLWLLVLTK